MVINGGARSGSAGYAGWLSWHLQREGDRGGNERVLVRSMDGVGSDNLSDGLAEMAAMSSGARSQRGLYHANIDWRADEQLTDAQKKRAVARLAEELGFTGQPYAVVEHVKEGREHLHVVWLRIDTETGLAIPDSHNYRKHEIVARELEREFGLERVQGVHVERDGIDRPARTPEAWEFAQADRSGITPAEARAELTAIWQRADNGQAFEAGLAAAGWMLARGDKRDFVVVDRAGETHSLSRRIEGAKAKDIRDRLADLDPASVPTVDQARQAQRDRQAEAGRAHVADGPDLPGISDTATQQPSQSHEIPDDRVREPAKPDPGQEQAAAERRRQAETQRQAEAERTAQILAAARRATRAPVQHEPELQQAAPAPVPTVSPAKPTTPAKEQTAEKPRHPLLYIGPEEVARQQTADQAARLAAEEAADLAADRARRDREQRGRQHTRGTPENDLARAVHEIARTDQATAQRMGWMPGERLSVTPWVPTWQQLADRRQAEADKTQGQELGGADLPAAPRQPTQEPPHETEKPAGRTRAPENAELGRLRQFIERGRVMLAQLTERLSLARVQLERDRKAAPRGIDAMIEEARRRAQQKAKEQLRQDLSRDHDDGGRELGL